MNVYHLCHITFAIICISFLHLSQIVMWINSSFLLLEDMQANSSGGLEVSFLSLRSSLPLIIEVSSVCDIVIRTWHGHRGWHHTSPCKLPESWRFTSMINTSISFICILLVEYINVLTLCFVLQLLWYMLNLIRYVLLIVNKFFLNWKVEADFPGELEQLGSVLEHVEEHHATRQRLSAEMADQSAVIRTCSGRGCSPYVRHVSHTFLLFL